MIYKDLPLSIKNDIVSFLAKDDFVSAAEIYNKYQRLEGFDGRGS